MERKDLFKVMRGPSMAESLAKRCKSMKAERQEKRREFFWGGVVASEVSLCTKANEIEKKRNLRIEMLKKWKTEKMKKLEEAKKNKKPVFKVGVVQRKITGSPVFSQQKTCIKNNLLNKQCQVKSQINLPKDAKAGVITRARARGMAVKPIQAEKVNPTIETALNNKFCKINKNKIQQVNSKTFKAPEVVSKLPCSSLTFACSPKFTKTSKKLTATKVKAAAKSEQKPEEDVPKENFVKDDNNKSAVTTPEKPKAEQDDFKPIYYSPFVTIRSGKKSNRKSKKKLTMDVEEQIEKEEKEFHCRIFSFRKYIECETKRLREVCDRWKHIYEEFPELPTDVEGDIDSAIGKTNLLTSDKFNQFRGLIDKCENGDPFVKVDDLQGFQDWVAIEVERIDAEFYKLDTRKANNWRPELAPTQALKKQQPATAKNPPKKPVGKSNIRSHILAARKFMKEAKANGGEGSQLPVAFSFEEPVRAKTPRKDRSLLKEVLNPERKRGNESSKKSPAVRESRNSGLEIMMATRKNKFPTPVKKSPLVTDYEVFFEEDKTPNRSILKKTPAASSSSKAHVTFKKLSENGAPGERGLSEKYFQPLTDSDESSPMRTILGDLGNLSVGRMRTRSRTRLMSLSASMSPMVN